MTSTIAGPAPAPVPTAAHVVDRLVEEHLLAPAERERAVGVVAQALADRPARPAARGGMSALVEVVAYLGAALVLAAGSLFAATLWDELSFAAQVGLVAVGVVALGAGGLLVPQGGASGDSRRRLASTLLTGSAALTALLVGLLVDRAGGTPAYDSSRVDLTMLAASLAGLVVVLVGYVRAPSALGQLGAAAAATTAVFAVADPFDGGAAITVLLAVLAAAWLLATERRWWHEDTVGRVVGLGLAFWAAQWLVVDGTAAVGYVLTALLAVGGTAAYLRLGAWPYLAVAVVAVTVVVPEAVTDWTGGGLGSIGAVLLTGVTLLVASGLGALLRSRRES